jgi:2-polyprenyl-6-methoxyphenol hydroxylase-like FAD-dependent oxidoreductase
MSKFPKLPASGIQVIIVGAGFAGLTAAIECDRKGHSVILFDRVPKLEPLGDIISFGQNSTRIMQRWPGVWDALEPIIHHTDDLVYHDWQGKYISTQSFRPENAWGRRINGHRGEIHLVFYEHAKARGIDIRLGQNVVDYFEDAAGKHAGVRLETGETFTADVVLAAEGIKSKGRKIVLGYEEMPRPSGYAVYRTWFPSDELAKNPLTKHLVVNGDTHSGWIGRDIHFLSASIKDGKEFSWVMTHKDDGDIEEDWQFPGKVEDVLKWLDGWDPIVHAQVKATPPGRLFDYKLVYREPLPTFISPTARVALIGDAAHPFLPTSIQGASQSMEDGVVMAACLDRAGKDREPEAVRVWEKIRYERVHKVQQTGVTTRENWHRADWDSIWKDPTLIHLDRPAWILNFDAEEDAYGNYAAVRAALVRRSAKAQL